MDGLSLLTALLDARHASARLSLLSSFAALTLSDVDALLYQFLFLYANWQLSNYRDECADFAKLLERQCARSCHLAIKCKWYCDAVAASYTADGEAHVGEALQDLAKRVEVAFVNARHSKPKVARVATTITDNDNDSGSKWVRCSVSVSDSGEASVTICPSATTAATAPSPSQPPVDADIALALAKKQRSDYFDRVIHLAAVLNDISDKLIPLPPDDRQAAVKRHVQVVQKLGKDLYLPPQSQITLKKPAKSSASRKSSWTRSITRQLTLPQHPHSQTMRQSHSANDINVSNPEREIHDIMINHLRSERASAEDAETVAESLSRHYRIHRFISSDSAALSSAKRAPFLLVAEVEYSGLDCFDEAIYQSSTDTFQSALEDEITAPPSLQHRHKSIGNGSANGVSNSKTITPRSQTRSRKSSVEFSSSSIPSQSQAQSHSQSEPRLRSNSDARHLPQHPVPPSVPKHSKRSTAPSSPSRSMPIQSPPQRQSSAGSSQPAPQSALSRLPSQHRINESLASGVALRSLPWAALDRAFGPSRWQIRKETIRAASPLAKRVESHRWDLVSVMVKCGDDAIAQDLLASQFIAVMHEVFVQAQLPIYIRPISICLTGATSAYVETISDAASVDSIKKKFDGHCPSIGQFFNAYFTHPQQTFISYRKALDNFVSSLAGYSLLSYVLACRDRHNGNIMLTREGHLVHIDFGFLLGNSPGHNWNFETAPFKMTQEYWEILSPTGSVETDNAQRFSALFEAGFMELRARFHSLMTLVRSLTRAKLPCFTVNEVSQAIHDMRDRLCVDMSESDARKRARELIGESVNHWRSHHYDLLQYYSNGIH